MPNKVLCLTTTVVVMSHGSCLAYYEIGKAQARDRDSFFILKQCEAVRWYIDGVRIRPSVDRKGFGVRALIDKSIS
jgi:hypothetical protein